MHNVSGDDSCVDNAHGFQIIMCYLERFCMMYAMMWSLDVVRNIDVGFLTGLMGRSFSIIDKKLLSHCFCNQWDSYRSKNFDNHWKDLPVLRIHDGWWCYGIWPADINLLPLHTIMIKCFLGQILPYNILQL